MTAPPERAKSVAVGTLGQLSSQALKALKDFKLQLKFSGKAALDKSAFDTMLDSMGYKRSREGLWEEFLTEVSEALGFKVSEVSEEGLKALYQQDMYGLLNPADNVDPGEALLRHVDHLMQEHDQDGSDAICRQEAQDMLTTFLGSTTPEEIDTLFDHLDEDKSLSLSSLELKKGLLKFAEPVDDLLPAEINYNVLDPAHTSVDEFLAVLEQYAVGSFAVNHHFLQSLGCCGHGSETPVQTLRFLTHYQIFSRGFLARVNKVKDMLPDQKHKDILAHNIEEEMGNYHEEDFEEMAKYDIKRESVDKIKHSELFDRCLRRLEEKIGVSFREFVSPDISEPLVSAFAACDTIPKLLGALYFASEFIVPHFYKYFVQALKFGCGFSNDEACFFILHCDLDEGHAAEMKKIVRDYADTKEKRLAMALAAISVLDARTEFMNRFSCEQNALTISVDKKAFAKADALYDQQASKWSREKPTCLSDFTGRPRVFEMCESHVLAGKVLDVGCGEGYVARKLLQMGAQKIVGSDISPGMIEKANLLKGPNEYYFTASCDQLRKRLVKESYNANIALGANFELGYFDLAVAVFLFNYTSIAQMKKTMVDVFKLLKPNGAFVFSVPHPFMVAHQKEQFGFDGAQQYAGHYFSLRDKSFPGKIKTTNGQTLDVRMCFKTMDDYFKTLQEVGFEIVHCEEARVKPEHMKQDPVFFSSVTDLPLHLIFKVKKPEVVVNLGSARTLDVLQEQIFWTPAVKRNLANSLVMPLSDAANKELTTVALRCYQDGVTAETFEMGKHALPSEWSATKRFASMMRNNIMRETGGALVRGLDMKELGGVEKLEQMTECSKIVYFILCSHLGMVDATARGRLFDVKSANLNAMDKKADNVLFSVSDTEAGWHTDGASRDAVYDVVSLLCISPAASGGEFKVSNFCNAFQKMRMMMPDFFFYELERPLPRDVLENGQGKGSIGVVTRLSRNEGLLAMRIRNNSYPILLQQGSQMRARYMRFWIETGHLKTGWKVPVLLKIAMDMLDDQLDAETCFHEALIRGDMIFANNSIIAHARDAFKNNPDGPPRHKVRAWIQVQKVMVLEESLLGGNQSQSDVHTN